MAERLLHETLADGVQILRWPHRHALPEREVLAFFEARGVPATRWTNAPGSVYQVHHHPYRKTLFCIAGTITFSLPDSDVNVPLAPGDRLILPAGTRHGATVGPDGVTCIEGAGA
ncbi:MAG: cupin domain-containing protein [Nitrospirota bacterium]